ncbi:S49 family peptidase [Halosolutus amylolyticus]|uniref:S49 family peptidase n=1 Tax=Halosolutus amylolyticus TaxID=2932267 RepID=A0ABD5PNG7_9EURY|nr:S49 family peptidase [Halosolutus amylolyticus]
MTLWPIDKIPRRQQLAVVALVAVIVGALVAPQVYGQTSDDDGTVAVIEVNGIIHSGTSQFVEDELREARHNDSIEAVVLDVDSGGGSPGSSERMYTAVERTAQEMPVIAAVDSIGASGAYYTMLTADDIYVAPTAQVGSVGVAGPAPMPSGPNEGNSAPDKGTFHPDDDRAQTETIQEVFLESVMENRGDELELDREEVAHARTYTGVEAVENGYADEIGTVDDAIYEVADRAGLDSFEISTHRPDGESMPPLFQATTDGDVVVTAAETELSPYQPLLVTQELWYDLFGTQFETHAGAERSGTGSDGHEPSNSSADHTGGEAP